MNTFEQDLGNHMRALLSVHFRLSNPLSQLHLMEQKIAARGYQPFDRQDIMDELGRLQHITGELHSAMLKIHDLLIQTKN